MAPRDTTPRPTKVALLTTLATTACLAAFALAGGAEQPRDAGLVLAALTALFLVRVVGQVLVVLRAPSSLPPMGDWNLLPYRILLPIQLLFLAVMTALVLWFLAVGTAAPAPQPGFGRFLIGVSAVYALSMTVRYAVRMRRRPSARWFGGTIPIVFHVVLATFVLTLGAYHAGT